ncbi:MAG: 16S rRNA processing protein RimM [Desulfobulbaceae bacterium]|nr:16S rRNA processing protein RimM [Desulfobulbaceae bacterium]
MSGVSPGVAVAGNTKLPENERFVRIGRVAKPHGIKGELKVQPYGEPEDFRHFPEVSLGGESAPSGPLHKVVGQRPQAKTVLVVLADLGDRTAAEAVVGREVWGAEKYLPPLAEDEFYWHELVGLRVIVEGGRELGKVTGIFATGGHDVLVVRGSGREYLIPARREFMLHTDHQSGVLTVADIPGLFDLND